MVDEIYWKEGEGCVSEAPFRGERESGSYNPTLSHPLDVALSLRVLVGSQLPPTRGGARKGIIVGAKEKRGAMKTPVLDQFFILVEVNFRPVDHSQVLHSLI